MITNRELDLIDAVLVPQGPVAVSASVPTTRAGSGGAGRRLGRSASAPAAAVADDRPDDEPDEYVLLFDEVAAAGWSLQCRHRGRTAWTLPLAPRGAAPRTTTRTAQAVAVRVLSGLGVFVSGWNAVGAAADDDGPSDRAVAASGPLWKARRPVQLRGAGTRGPSSRR